MTCRERFSSKSADNSGCGSALDDEVSLPVCIIPSSLHEDAGELLIIPVRKQSSSDEQFQKQVQIAQNKNLQCEQLADRECSMSGENCIKNNRLLDTGSVHVTATLENDHIPISIYHNDKISEQSDVSIQESDVSIQLNSTFTIDSQMEENEISLCCDSIVHPELNCGKRVSNTTGFLDSTFTEESLAVNAPMINLPSVSPKCSNFKTLVEFESEKADNNNLKIKKDYSCLLNCISREQLSIGTWISQGIKQKDVTENDCVPLESMNKVSKKIDAQNENTALFLDSIFTEDSLADAACMENLPCVSPEYSNLNALPEIVSENADYNNLKIKGNVYLLNTISINENLVDTGISQGNYQRDFTEEECMPVQSMNKESEEIDVASGNNSILVLNSTITEDSLANTTHKENLSSVSPQCSELKSLTDYICDLALHNNLKVKEGCSSLVNTISLEESTADNLVSETIKQKEVSEKQYVPVKSMNQVSEEIDVANENITTLDLDSTLVEDSMANTTHVENLPKCSKLNTLTEFVCGQAVYNNLNVKEGSSPPENTISLEESTGNNLVSETNELREVLEKECMPVESMSKVYEEIDIVSGNNITLVLDSTFTEDSLGDTAHVENLPCISTKSNELNTHHEFASEEACYYNSDVKENSSCLLNTVSMDKKTVDTWVSQDRFCLDSRDQTDFAEKEYQSVQFMNKDFKEIDVVSGNNSTLFLDSTHTENRLAITAHVENLPSVSPKCSALNSLTEFVSGKVVYNNLEVMEGSSCIVNTISLQKSTADPVVSETIEQKKVSEKDYVPGESMNKDLEEINVVKENTTMFDLHSTFTEDSLANTAHIENLPKCSKLNTLTELESGKAVCDNLEIKESSCVMNTISMEKNSADTQLSQGNEQKEVTVKQCMSVQSMNIVSEEIDAASRNTTTLVLDSTFTEDRLANTAHMENLQSVSLTCRELNSLTEFVKKGSSDLVNTVNLEENTVDTSVCEKNEQREVIQKECVPVESMSNVSEEIGVASGNTTTLDLDSTFTEECLADPCVENLPPDSPKCRELHTLPELDCEKAVYNGLEVKEDSVCLLNVVSGEKNTESIENNSQVSHGNEQKGLAGRGCVAVECIKNQHHFGSESLEIDNTKISHLGGVNIIVNGTDTAHETHVLKECNFQLCLNSNDTKDTTLSEEKLKTFSMLNRSSLHTKFNESFSLRENNPNSTFVCASKTGEEKENNCVHPFAFNSPKNSRLNFQPTSKNVNMAHREVRGSKDSAKDGGTTNICLCECTEKINSEKFDTQRNNISEHITIEGISEGKKNNILFNAIVDLSNQNDLCFSGKGNNLNCTFTKDSLENKPDAEQLVNESITMSPEKSATETVLNTTFPKFSAAKGNESSINEVLTEKVVTPENNLNFFLPPTSQKTSGNVEESNSKMETDNETAINITFSESSMSNKFYNEQLASLAYVKSHQKEINETIFAASSILGGTLTECNSESEKEITSEKKKFDRDTSTVMAIENGVCSRLLEQNISSMKSSAITLLDRITHENSCAQAKEEIKEKLVHPKNNEFNNKMSGHFTLSFAENGTMADKQDASVFSHGNGVEEEGYHKIEVHETEKVSNYEGKSPSCDTNLLLDEVFKDPSTFDFLTQCGNTNSIRDLRKESLYIKFDPLVGSPRTNKQIKQSLPLLPVLQNTEKKNCIADSEGIWKTNEVKRISNKEINSNCEEFEGTVENFLQIKISTCPSEDSDLGPALPNVTHEQEELGALKEMISKLEKELDVSKEENSKLEKELVASKETISKQEQLLTSNKKNHKDEIAHYSSIIMDMNFDIAKMGEEIDLLKKYLKDKEEEILALRSIMAEFDKTVVSLVSEKDKCSKMLVETDLKLQLLMQQKIAEEKLFDSRKEELSKKCESLESTLKELSESEKKLMSKISRYDKALDIEKKKYQALKSHASKQLESANSKWEAEQTKHQLECTKLNSALSQSELKVKSLQEELEQKVKENKQLTSMCKELLERFDR